MARGRTIKPEFFRDKLMGRLGSQVGTVYEALWCWADDGASDEGGVAVVRIEPDVLKGECFMRWPEYTTGVLTDCLVRLYGAGRIRPFAVGDELYAELPKLGDHSPINHPSQFRYPRGGERVDDIAAWLSGQYTPGLLRDHSAPSIQIPEPSPGTRSLKDKAGADAPLDTPIVFLPPTPLMDGPEPLGAFYATRLKPLLWVKPNQHGNTQREVEGRDISVLKRQLAKVPREDIVDAVTEMRRAAEAGELPDFVEPGQNFGLMALLAKANGGIATFERFRHEAVKRRECAA